MKLFRSARFLLLACMLCMIPASSFAGVFINISVAPPALPVYVQPPCPTDGYMWTPGYWAYDNPDVGYYWVPGAWVPAPAPGLLWTPGYWGWNNGVYIFNAGYWGPHIGYYGGVNYGFGYMGWGFAGGEWRGGHFFYNTAIMHVGGGFHNVYVNETIVRQTTYVNANRVSFAGGRGGLNYQPRPEERAAMNDHHLAPTAVQRDHIAAAARDPQQRFNANHGRPANVASARPLTAGHDQPGNRGAEHGDGGARPAAAARPEAHNAPAARSEARPAAQARPESRPAQESRPAAQSHAESRPAPQPHAAPQAHAAPKPSGGKPHER